MRSKAKVCGLLIAGVAGSIPLGAWMFVSCVYVVFSCVGRGLCDGLITRPEESYRVPNCILMCDHRNPERGPMFQVGNERKMIE
jgi:hypothetical protein